MPVIPATQEAEAGELSEPRRRRLRWAEIMPLHSSLGNKSKTSFGGGKKQKEWDLSQGYMGGSTYINPKCDKPYKQSEGKKTYDHRNKYKKASDKIQHTFFEDRVLLLLPS